MNLLIFSVCSWKKDWLSTFTSVSASSPLLSRHSFLLCVCQIYNVHNDVSVVIQKFMMKKKQQWKKEKIN